MRPKVVAALALTVTALTLFVWLVERDLPSSDERRARAGRVIPAGLEGATVLTIERSGQRAVLSKRGPNAADSAAWWLESPVAGRADGEKVEALVEALGSLEKKRELESIDPASSGLWQPNTSIRINRGDEETLVVVGRTVPATDDVIIEADGIPIVVSSEFLSFLEEAPGDWRSRDVFPLDRSEIKRVTLTDRDGSMVLSRHDDGFVLEKPVEDDASEPDVSELLEMLVSLEVKSFLDGSLPPDASALEPTFSVKVERDGEGEPMVLDLVGAADESGEISAVSEGQRITIGSGLLDVLARPDSSWQSRAWSSFRPFEIDRAVLQIEETSLVLERREGGWLRDGAAVESSRVSELLEKLTELEGGVIEGALAGHAGDEFVLRVEIAGDRAAETLVLQHSDAGFIARRRGRQVALAISESVALDFLAAIEEVRLLAPLGAGSGSLSEDSERRVSGAREPGS